MTSSIQAFNPSPGLIDYAMTKAAQVAFTKALAEELGREGHPRERRRARPDLDARSSRRPAGTASASEFGQDTPLGRAGQPAELAAAYVLLASQEASYVSGAVLPVTGGKGL